MNHIIIIAEIFEDRINRVTWELIAAAREILKNYSGQPAPPVHIIVPAENPVFLSEKIAKQTGMDVIGLQIPEFKAYTSEIYIDCLERLIKTMHPSHILIAHTSQGRDFAPGLALRLNAASIPGVNGIRSQKKRLIYSRPILNNTRNMLVKPDPDRPVVLTLMPGIFTPDIHQMDAGEIDLQKPRQTDIRKIHFTPHSKGEGCIRHIKILKKICNNQAIKEAKVIVAAGRGIGKQENLKLVEKFAECFSSSALGVSRPLVDMGWIGYEHQVGITGADVTPELYIACGISGSSQHIAGMKDAKFVISINKNPNAPIFRHSDLCITEDVIEFIHSFLQIFFKRV